MLFVALVALVSDQRFPKLPPPDRLVVFRFLRLLSINGSGKIIKIYPGPVHTWHPAWIYESRLDEKEIEDQLKRLPLKDKGWARVFNPRFSIFDFRAVHKINGLVDWHLGLSDNMDYLPDDPNKSSLWIWDESRNIKLPPPPAQLTKIRH